MEDITDKAKLVISQLESVRAERNRTYPSDIEAVLIFSGPGTYYEKLKPNQPEWQRWMDRDRIRAGIAVQREVTATKIKEQFGVDIKGHDVGYEDILKYGPFLIYNGIPVENVIFRQFLSKHNDKLPKEKVLIIDKVQRNNSVDEIKHTGDQYLSFYQEISMPTSSIHNINKVALVSHIPHFVRHPFYARKYNDIFEEQLGRRLVFWAYGLKNRDNGDDHMRSELERLVIYAQRGDLAAELELLNI